MKCTPEAEAESEPECEPKDESNPSSSLRPLRVAAK